jgi:hypothetical protein
MAWSSSCVCICHWLANTGMLCAVLCLQLVIFGGQQRVDDRISPIQQSTYVHLVDLDVTPLRWRVAPVANIATYGLDPLAFPSTSAVSVPGQKVVALKHNKVG